ncbi:MAG: calcium-binding protein [Gemmobacter sp.]|uniref:calcium-binding protein n=1 Tax=Gemmobacter sp. TaxID=1898957 RepID=UPI001A3E374C|nr:calcium-binding protein [Gemmobacter sp.]MBL8563678.1 calcium-binding protein [Gemmobacter sp.]
MELILLMSLGLAAFFMPFGSDTSEDSGEPQEPEEPESVPIGPDFIRDDAGDVTGTQGDDGLSYEDYLAAVEAGEWHDPEELIEVITAGAGNDTINLMPDDGLEQLLWADGDESVYGGAGDDVIHLPSVIGVEIFGGAGRDDLLVGSNPSDPVSVFGGAGSDRLDGTLMDNGYLYGDGGNDLFSLSDPASIGTGYVKIAYGGAGDDSLTVDATGSFSMDVVGIGGSTDYHDFYGGAGRDSLEVTLHEGLLDDDTVLENGSQFGDAMEWLVEGDAVRLQTIEFADFVKGEDRITLNVRSVNDNFDLAEIRMEEQLGEDGAAETVITASYASDTFLTREVSFSVRAVGLSWEDIDVPGVDPVLLAPVVRLS